MKIYDLFSNIKPEYFPTYFALLKILFDSPQYIDTADSRIRCNPHPESVVMANSPTRWTRRQAAAPLEIGELDLITIPGWTWHQFRAAADAPLGFLCLVDSARDRPVLPAPEDIAALRAHPQVAAFLDG